MDIALIPDQFGDPDIRFGKGDAILDEGLETAVYISLFTDRRDESAEDPSDKRGWWGDTLEEKPVGSLLWTLDRSKLTTENLAKFKYYIEDALAWMIEDRIASKIVVDVSVVDNIKGIAVANVEIVRPNGESEKFSLVWDRQAANPVHIG